MVDNKLYIPEKWFADEHLEKRNKCGFPADLSFKTKPQLAAEMLRKIQSEEVLPFRYVAADSIYGENQDFIWAVEENVGLIYFVSVGKDTSFWIKQPAVTQKKSKRKNRTKTVLKKGEASPTTAKEFAENLNNYF